VSYAAARPQTAADGCVAAVVAAEAAEAANRNDVALCRL
jgi:hypothetical protein